MVWTNVIKVNDPEGDEPLGEAATEGPPERKQTTTGPVSLVLEMSDYVLLTIQTSGKEDDQKKWSRKKGEGRTV